jgi:hypothetical protein
MSDPQLTRSRVTVRYHSDDGHSYLQEFMPQKTCPEGALLQGLEELARLTALFGFEDEARDRFNAARQRVADWKKAR